MLINELNNFYKAFSNKSYPLRTTFNFICDWSFKPGIPKYFSPFDFSGTDVLKYSIQSIDFPDLAYGGGNIGYDTVIDASTNLGNFKTPANTGLKGEKDTVAIGFIDTERNILESFFVKWMEECVGLGESGNKWINGSPFTRSDINISVRSNKENKEILLYKVSGAYPISVASPKFKYGEAQNEVIRAVIMSYNNVFVLNKSSANHLINSKVSMSNEYLKGVGMNFNDSYTSQFNENVSNKTTSDIIKPS